jgi:hypothetical protein
LEMDIKVSSGYGSDLNLPQLARLKALGGACRLMPHIVASRWSGQFDGQHYSRLLVRKMSAASIVAPPL